MPTSRPLNISAWISTCALCIAIGLAPLTANSQDATPGDGDAPPQPPAEDAAGDDPDVAGAENNPLVNEMTPALHEAVDIGFQYLRTQMNADGSFGRGRYGRNVAITSLAALAYMADGNLPGRGPYGEEVAEALEFVLRHSTESGLLAADTSHGPMYGHGFGTLFLAEIYGMAPDDHRVRDALVRAIELIIGSQNHEGGWRYNPVPYDADVSVTICQVMALRAARNAGIKVPKETIDRAVEYVRNCQNPDGGFKYMLQTGPSAWPRTAAGVATLFYAGIYEDDSIDRGLAYLFRTAMPGPGRMSGMPHYYYGHYYAVQSTYLAGGEQWERWWPAIRDELIGRQTANGSWVDHNAGSAYATSMALIILQMPKRYLPIFQK